MKQTKNKSRLFSFSKIAAVVLTANFIFANAAFSQSRLVKETSEDTPITTTVTPQYQIYEIIGTSATITATQAFGVSNAGVATGRYIFSGGSSVFSARRGVGLIGHPNLTGRTYCVGNATTQTSEFGGGATVGTCAATLFGTSRLPVIWRSGNPTQLPLPSGETLGDANDINAGDIAVGSVNSGSLQKAVYYSGTTATLISQTTANGSFFTTAYGINDSNRIVGTGIDPNNAARNVGMVFDIGTGVAFEVGALPGANGALAFGIGNGGHIVGSSMQNQGAGLPFIWTQAIGMVAIPLPTGTTQGSARGVNSSGWAVGTASSAFAIPFLYDGTNTYRLQDLIPSNTGWDLSRNTSSSAMAINDSNVIVGTGVLNGQTRGYIMVPGVANFSIGGRVSTADGRGIPYARLTISGGGLPGQLTTITNSFGYYKFENLQSDVAYTVSVSSKQQTFATPTRDVLASRNDVDFTAQ